jgi:hypothetical protein
MKGEGPNASEGRLKDMHVLALKRSYLKIECAVNTYMNVNGIHV